MLNLRDVALQLAVKSMNNHKESDAIDEGRKKIRNSLKFEWIPPLIFVYFSKNEKDRYLALSLSPHSSRSYIFHTFYIFFFSFSSVVIGYVESTRCLSSFTNELTPYGTPSWNHYTFMSTQYPTYLSYLYSTGFLSSLHRPLSLPSLLALLSRS